MKLFEPLKVRGITLKNRIYMLSMGRPGQVGDMAVNYYVARAKGGVAAITAGLVPTWERVLDNIDDMKPLIEAVHHAASDCKIAIQALPYYLGTDKIIVPSVPLHGATLKAFPLVEPVAMSKEEIKQYVERLAQSAYRQIRAGFDYIEVHGTHAYLLRQFFSPLDNHREDEYGGSLDNRMRFPLECVKAIRAAVGDDVPIFCKIPAHEPEEQGITLDESARYAIELEEAGVDVLVITIGMGSHARGYMNSVCPIYSYLRPGSFVDYAAFIKRHVSIPVAAVGKISKPEMAEAILQEGKADIVGMGRQLIADPDWPNKVASGAWGNIRPCLYCNACVDRTYKGEDTQVPDFTQNGLACTVNAQSCLEVPNQILPTSRPKKVLVLGGGPAGMEAARIAAIRGHDVTLYEKANYLGGTLRIASKPPTKENLNDFIRYLSLELRRTGVKVRLAEAVDADTVDKEKPDAVVVATGAYPRRLKIRGANGKNVAVADDVLAGRVHTGRKVLVVGGGQVGLEAAEFLATQGKAVILIEMLPEAGEGIFPTLRPAAVQMAKEAGVIMYLNCQPQEIVEGGAWINVAGTRKFVRVDSVVLAVGRESNNALWEQLQGKVPELHIIGDSVSPRTIRDAVHEGHRVGRTL